MVTIKLSVYEQGELIRYLEYAKEQKKANQPLVKAGQNKFDETKYDLYRINVLIATNTNYRYWYYALLKKTV